MKYPRYEKYRDSGVEWLGEIPEGWACIRLGTLCEKIGSGKTPRGGSEIYEDSGFLFIRSQNVYDDGLRLDDVAFIDDQTNASMLSTQVLPGDILLNITGASLGRTCIVPEQFPPANVNQHVCIIRARNIPIRIFLSYVMKSWFVKSQVDYHQNGAAREGLNFEQISKLYIPLPPQVAQDSIVSGLERQVSQVNTLIAEQEKLITLLKEKRQAVISHAVTKGLNPDAPMKDSGVEWLGMVPKGWDIVKFKHCAHIAEGLINPTERHQGEKILIAPDHVEKETGRILMLETAEQQGAISNKYTVSAGQIIYSKIRPALNKLCIAQGDWLCSADMYPLTPRDNSISEYLLYYMLSPVFVGYAQLISDRVAMPKINREQLSIVRIPIPPLSEQRTIVKYLDAETAKIDVLITETQKAVELLCERRTALISAAVTGKIDVRNFGMSIATQPVVNKPLDYFRRTVFAAEIVDQMCDKPEFGHVMFQKCLYVAQYHLRIDGFAENYFRQAAGPHDGTLLRSVEGQMTKGRLFQTKYHGGRYSYARMEKCGKLQDYFDGYFGTVKDEFNRVLALFRRMNTDQAEIVATLYAVWNDFLINNEVFDDAKIITEVLTNWDDTKKRFTKEQWERALQWMRDNGLAPTGFGKATKFRDNKRTS